MQKQLKVDIRQQMGSGDWFEAGDPLLAKDRAHATEVLRRFNCDLSLSAEHRRGLLLDLFGGFGEHSTVSAGTQVDYGYNIFIGARSFINVNCTFLDGARISIGDDVWVAPGVTFATPLHPLVARERNMRVFDNGTTHLRERNEPITIGNGVWIASNTVVCPGVTIGDGAVIGAGSVVTRDIPAETLAFGAPCKPVRAITADDSIAKDMLGAYSSLNRLND